jgi:hypothetical protein
VTPDPSDPAANRRAAALMLHALHGDELGRETVLAEASWCMHCSCGVMAVLAGTALGALRGYADDVDLEDMLARIVARAALAEASA